MLFSDLYKSPKSPLAKLRHSHPHAPLAVLGPDYDADLVSRDKAKQKEAVKRYLARKVRNDWDFISSPVSATSPASSPAVAHSETAVPPPSSPREGTEGAVVATSSHAQVDANDLEFTPAPQLATEAAPEDSGAQEDSETESIYSTVSEDPANYHPRAEWTSDLSDDEIPAVSPSPFRFDSPDAVGVVVQASTSARKTKRRRDVRADAKWNVGLACFLARRDAWTGARTVRVKPKLMSPASPTSPRRSLFRFPSHSKPEPPAPTTPLQTTPGTGSTTASPLSPVTSASRHSQGSAHETITPSTSDGDSHCSSQEPAQPPPEYPVETLLPIPPPLLPPANPMRASINPHIYVSLYDKVVVHSLQPSCPINLADMTRSCVAGWKRDGEWPPRPTEVPASGLVVVRRKKAEERRETIKERRDSAATVASSGRRMSFGALLGRGGGDEKQNTERDHDDAGTGKTIRKSLQRVLGLGHGHSASVGSIGLGIARESAAAG